MEAEKVAILGEKSAIEQEKLGLREELIRVEQEKMDVETEKSGEYATSENFKCLRIIVNLIHDWLQLGSYAAGTVFMETLSFIS